MLLRGASHGSQRDTGKVGTIIAANLVSSGQETLWWAQVAGSNSTKVDNDLLEGDGWLNGPDLKSVGTSGGQVVGGGGSSAGDTPGGIRDSVVPGVGEVTSA